MIPAIRHCSKCGASFISKQYWHTKRWYWQRKCPACLNKERKALPSYRNERTKARDRKYALERHNKPGFNKYGPENKWYGHGPSVTLYKKLRRAKIPKDEARAEALALFHKFKSAPANKEPPDAADPAAPANECSASGSLAKRAARG